MKRLDTEQDLAEAVDHLIAAEPRFAGVVARHGLPPLRHGAPSLETLLRIVTDQLISLKAGKAIWSRLAERLRGFEPHVVLSCPEAELRALGLSGAKARTFHAAARAFQGNGLGADEAEITQALLNIGGIGPWTASIYLMTAVRAPDAWPAADLALQHAARDLLGLAERPSRREMVRLAEPWRPFRTAAALLLWRHYRGLRQMPQG